jgi:hypothetical protein
LTGFPLGETTHNGTVSMFEREGFKRSRPLGKNHWVVGKSSGMGKNPAQRAETVIPTSTLPRIALE